MSSSEPARPVRLRALPLLLAGLAGCGTMMDDLAPTGSDRRPPVEPGSVGPAVGQTAPDFALSDSLGNPVTLYEALASSRGAVLYFTMWCNICFDHMRDIRSDVMGQNPDVRYFVVDYVSGSVAAARANQLQYAVESEGFDVLVDEGERWVGFYGAYMGVVVVDRFRVVQWNSDYFKERVPALVAGLP